MPRKLLPNMLDLRQRRKPLKTTMQKKSKTKQDKKDTNMICPIMSRQKLTNNNGVEFISPSYAECLQDKCAVWSMQNRGCGLRHED
jgi:hypothetical protein